MEVQQHLSSMGLSSQSKVFYLFISFSVFAYLMRREGEEEGRDEDKRMGYGVLTQYSFAYKTICVLYMYFYCFLSISLYIAIVFISCEYRVIEQLYGTQEQSYKQ